MSRQARGYSQIVAADRPLIEYDTINCAHCQRIIFLKPHTAATVYLVLVQLPSGITIWQEETGAGCWKCHAPVCLACHAAGVCRPIERWLDEQEGTRRPDQMSVGGFGH